MDQFYFYRYKTDRFTKRQWLFAILSLLSWSVNAQDLENTLANAWKIVKNSETTNFASSAEYMFKSPKVCDDGFYPNAYTWTGNFKSFPQNGYLTYNFSNVSDSSLFWRSSNGEKHRFWLNLSKGTQENNQMLVSYDPEATNGVDFGIDSELFGYAGSALYSLIIPNNTKYIIQGRALPFTDTDVVHLGLKATQAGVYKITLSNFDGLFTENQNIYIKDNQTSMQHNLKLSSYEFTSEEGTFNNRFEIAYIINAPCPTGNIIFNSQSHIDNFILNYPNCTEFTGSITIQGNNITDLSPLSNITTVNGNFYIIENTTLTNLNGLSALTSVSGNLTISNNPQLTNISGLQNINSTLINGLTITGNTNLSVCNLPNICTYLQGSGSRTISGNKEECLNETAVQNACELFGSCEDYTIWNGTQWSNGTPDTDKRAIIEGNLTITSNLTACELLLNSGIVTVNSSALLTVNGEIVNTQNENNFIVHNDANVIQVEDVENTGAITVKRNAVIKHLDYSTWSSPVLGQKLKAFSPYTLNNRIRIYDAVANTWKIVENPETTDFASGAGYMFRAPNVNDDGFYPNAYTWTGNFKGVPQNGNVTYNFSNATGVGLYQSIGNPYPSNISRANFHSVNPQIGTLYFWTNTNAAVNGVYVGNNYATINRAGEAVNVISTQGGQNSLTPNGYIAVGQGFLAQTNGIINQAVFTNSMRTSENALFLRSSNDEKHRFWLNLSKGTQEHNQMLVSYNEEATNDVDFGIDSELFGYTGSALYSLINQNQTKYVIQGRALPFTDIDVVPLGFKATEAGIYKVSLSDFDGIFTENQNIYIKDNQTSTQHNLKLSNYEFASLEGTFDDRFEIVYTDSILDVTNPEYNNNWIVYKQTDLFHIQTQGFEMKEVVVYDMLGRIVYSAKAQGNNHQINGLDTNGVYIVKIITNNNIVLNKKVQ